MTTKKRFKKGKLIVFEGVDACGKATQTRMFVKRLRLNGYKVKQTKYPRYNKFYGKLTGRYLKGEFGGVGISPYLSCLPYVLDRLDERDRIVDWLKKGNIFVCDRYAVSTTTFHGAKLKNRQERNGFIKWHEQCEYEVNRLPRPDIIIFLDVPVMTSQKLLKLKGYRQYMGERGKDIHERNIHYLKEVERLYKEQIKKGNNWAYVECIKNGKLMSKGEIAEIVWKKIEKKIV